ncbi:DUF6171 family protein [Cohnella zeiphila]|uniref:Uncharacterized protein n=1 Tax=Cohnella zeiphila TaxID=2761120 RepID=A0A7X0VUL3_9BACL|nr:DUF6171 family protein [Cohnella zeiphila]MBB6730387.1 hypothetical protein [Cohnella zeiphila]
MERLERTATDGGCKGCSETVRRSPQEIEDWMTRRMSGPEWPSVPDDEYERRLDRCRSCPELAYGTTCKICGCFVQVRAKLPDARCPYPYEPRW